MGIRTPVSVRPVFRRAGRVSSRFVLTEQRRIWPLARRDAVITGERDLHQAGEVFPSPHDRTLGDLSHREDARLPGLITA